MTKKTEQDKGVDPFARFADEAKADETPVDVPQQHKNGDPLLRKDGTPVVLRVVGAYSAKYKAAERRFHDQVMKFARRGVDISGERSAKMEAERVAAAVVGWNLDDAAGVDVPFSPENVARYLLAAEWNAKNVQIAIREPESFFANESDN